MGYPFTDTFTVGANTTLDLYSADWGAIADNSTINVNAANDWCIGSGAGFRLGVNNQNDSSLTTYRQTVTGATIGTTSGDGIGAAIRHDGGVKTACNTYYGAILGNGNYMIKKISAGVVTDLVAETAITVVAFSAATVYDVSMEMDDSGNWAFKIDDIEQDSGTEETPHAAGNSGFYLVGTSAYVTEQTTISTAPSTASPAINSSIFLFRR